jgi:hypothetical protein
MAVEMVELMMAPLLHTIKNHQKRQRERERDNDERRTEREAVRVFFSFVPWSPFP